MKIDLDSLKDSIQNSYDSLKESITAADKVLDYFHNRQYDSKTLAILKDRGQPPETFNIIKLFGRLLLGYYSTIVNNVVVSPVQFNDVDTAAILNDLVKHTFEQNRMETEGDKFKLDALLVGLMCVFIDVKDTDKTDVFGRVIKQITIQHVPALELLIDPNSSQEDYSDAEFIHRYKWISEEDLIKLFPKKKKKIKELQEYYNHLELENAEFEDTFNVRFTGKFKQKDYYMLVHTIAVDEKDRRWSIFWVDELELSKQEITFKEVKFPYRLHKTITSDRAEFYGIFKDVMASQDAINQATLKIQNMVSTQKALVEDGGTDNLDEFTQAFSRVNGVIPVKKLAKINVINTTRDVQDLYIIIDKAFNRIQRVLGVNDSFLGLAFASDSGRKVKLQQNQTTMALRYLSLRIEQFYRLIGWDTINLQKQYYTAFQVVRVVDEVAGTRWIAINEPMKQWSGQFDEQGQPVMEFVWGEVIDPATGKPQIDRDGNLVVAPVPTAETEIAFTDADVSIDSVAFNDQDEKAQLLLETMLSGTIGQTLAQVNMSGFLALSAQAVKGLKSKYSPNMVAILEQTALAMQQAPQPEISGSSSPKSSELKLPQNTNEA